MCASSITSEFVKASLGIADSVDSIAACKTRQRDSVNRFVIYFYPCSTSFESCPVPSTVSPSIVWRLAIVFGALCISLWVLSFGEWQIKWLGCSRVELRITCSTALSHSSSCWRSCYEGIRLDCAIDGNRVGTHRSTRLSRLGESVSRVAAE